MKIEVDQLIALIGSRGAVRSHREWINNRIGGNATDVADQLVGTVMTRLGQDQRWRQYTQPRRLKSSLVDPAFANTLVEALESDPAFAREVGGLMEAFEAATPDDFNVRVVRGGQIGDQGRIVIGTRADSREIGTVAYAPPPGPITIPDKPS